MTHLLCPSCGIDLVKAGPTQIGSLVVDQFGDTTWDGEPIHLTDTERLLVAALARGRGRTIARYALENIVDSNGYRVVDVHLCRIRAKFHAVDPSFAAIENIRGRGYRWKVASGAEQGEHDARGPGSYGAASLNRTPLGDQSHNLSAVSSTLESSGGFR
jgi:DNA-binding winged helix-turn-helix (wHTH) protein